MKFLPLGLAVPCALLVCGSAIGFGQSPEEAQSAADGTLQHKIVYNYDSSGKQTGYSVFDASGKLVSGKGAAIVRASPSPKPREKNRRCEVPLRVASRRVCIRLLPCHSRER